MNASLDVKLRLRQIAQRSAALSAVRSELADMALQLDHLRRLNGRTRLLINRGDSANGKRGHAISSRGFGSD